MRFIILILLLLSFPLFAGTKHIVFQVNGTLVQEIYGKNQVKNHQIAIISEFREIRQFAVYEGVSELLYALYSRPDVVIHFADSDTDLARRLLEKIRVNGKYRLNQLMDRGSRLFTIPYKGSVNFASELRSEEFLFVTSRSRDEQVTDALHLVNAGNQLHFYESYAQAEKEREGSYSKDNFPANIDEWTKSMKRSFLLASIILPQLAKSNFLEEVQKAQKENSNVLMKRSEVLARNFFLERDVKFRLSTSQLSSCSVFNLYTGRPEKDLALADCSRYFGEHISVQYDIKNNSCTILIPQQILSRVALDSCLKLKKYSPIFSYDLKTCSAFDTKNRRIADLPLSECKGQGVYVYEPQNQVYLFGTYKSSYLSMSLEKIIKDIWPLPDEKNLLRVWFPWQRDQSIGFAWRNCIDDLEGGHPIRFLEESAACRGDTFYSWGSLHKIESLKKVMGQGIWQKQMQALYLARTPISSFGYGPYAVRVKVRSDVSWKRIDYSVTPCSSGNVDKTIYFRTKPVYESALFDIIVCSPQVIESWSYGTREHYDEIVKDVEWTILKKRSEELTEMYINDPKFLNEKGIDGMDFRVEGIYPRLKNHLNLSRENKGEIFSNPSISRRAEHFQTRYPIYFNEQ